MLQAIEKFDIWLFYLINHSGQNRFFDWLMPFISNEKNFYILFLIAGLLLVLQKNAKYRVIAVAVVVLISLSETVCTDVLKPAIGRLRPYDAIGHVRVHDNKTNQWKVTPDVIHPRPGSSRSMPSAHATNIFAAACFLSYFFWRWRYFFYSVAFIVGYSRVYLGVHFPLDVIVGALTGTACAAGVIWCTNALLRRWFGGHPPEKKDSPA